MLEEYICTDKCTVLHEKKCYTTGVCAEIPKKIILFHKISFLCLHLRANYTKTGFHYEIVLNRNCIMFWQKQIKYAFMQLFFVMNALIHQSY